jgi:uncharacterized protein (TIGR03435 family)
MDRRIRGGPKWIRTERFDVEAKTDEAKISRTDLLEMLQELLGHRFKLKISRSKVDVSGYALVLAKGGPKLTVAGPEDRRSVVGRVGELIARNAPMADLAQYLSLWIATGSPVEDHRIEGNL